MRLKNFAKTLVSGVCATALIPAGLLAVAAAGNLADESPAGNLAVSTSVANTPKFLAGCIGSDQLGYEKVRINKLPAGKDWFLTVSDSDQNPFPSRDSYTNPNGGGYMYSFEPGAEESSRWLEGSVGNSGLGLAGSYHFDSSVKDLHPWVFVQLEDEIYGALRVNTGCEYDFSTVLENNTFDKYLEIKKFLVNPQTVKQDWNPLLTLHQFRAPEVADLKVLDTRPAPQPETEPSHPDVPEVPDTPEAPTVERPAPTLDPAEKKTTPRAANPSSSSAAASKAATSQRQAANPAPAQPAPVRTIIQNRENTRTVTVPGPVRYREAPTTSSNNASNNNSSNTSDNSVKPAQEGSGNAQESTGNGTASQVQGVEEPKAAPSAPAAARAANANPSVVDRMGGLGTIAAIAVLGLIGAGGAIALTRSLMNG